MTMKTVWTAVVFVGISSVAYSQSFDGVYNGSFDGSVTAMSCNLDFQGMDGGPFVIKGNTFFAVEGQCDLANPTKLRGIDGRLFDATCYSEGKEDTSRILFLRDPEGVVIHHRGQTQLFRNCK